MVATTAKQAFEGWFAAIDSGNRGQPPSQELLAEHHVMEVVLGAMEAEAEAMLTGSSLRTEFWTDIVDFNGNFVHMCHRAKEEEFLIPALVEHGLLDARQQEAIHQEHLSGKDLTMSLCEGVGEADWEKVLRLVSIYMHILRPHMRREETGIFAAAANLPAAAQERLQRAFAEVERRALGPRGRRHFVAVARRLVRGTGIANGLPDDGA